MTYPKCADCQSEINEGRTYKCDIEGCRNVMCLNCVEMIDGYNFCNYCYAKDYVGYRV